MSPRPHWSTRMRNDFAEEVKRILAARVNYLCSNPECCAQTTGPQENAVKSINVGVAAHITAAAPGGPRFNSLLSAEERCHCDNGIWLCQNCAKMVDSDVLRFHEKLLQAWKTLAEDRARHALGKTAYGNQGSARQNGSPAHILASVEPTESEAQRKQREILRWKGKLITHSLMNTGRAVALLGPVYGSSAAQVVDCTEFYVTVGGSNWSRSIALANVEISFDGPNNRLELQERHS